MIRGTVAQKGDGLVYKEKLISEPGAPKEVSVWMQKNECEVNFGLMAARVAGYSEGHADDGISCGKSAVVH